LLLVGLGDLWCGRLVVDNAINIATEFGISEISRLTIVAPEPPAGAGDLGSCRQKETIHAVGTSWLNIFNIS
jgi:hypothetical protein